MSKHSFLKKFSPFSLLLTLFSVSSLYSAPVKGALQGEFILQLTSSINVKNYPPDIQAIFPLFEAKCNTCHGEKETVRSPGVLPSYWEETVEKMRAMPKADFSQEEGKKIADFLIYDSFERRRVELKKQLKALPPEQLKKEQELLDGVINKYKH